MCIGGGGQVPGTMVTALQNQSAKDGTALSPEFIAAYGAGPGGPATPGATPTAVDPAVVSSRQSASAGAQLTAGLGAPASAVAVLGQAANKKTLLGV